MPPQLCPTKAWHHLPWDPKPRKHPRYLAAGCHVRAWYQGGSWMYPDPNVGGPPWVPGCCSFRQTKKTVTGFCWSAVLHLPSHRKLCHLLCKHILQRIFIGFPLLLLLLLCLIFGNTIKRPICFSIFCWTTLGETVGVTFRRVRNVGLSSQEIPALKQQFASENSPIGHEHLPLKSIVNVGKGLSFPWNEEVSSFPCLVTIFRTHHLSLPRRWHVEVPCHGGGRTKKFKGRDDSGVEAYQSTQRIEGQFFFGAKSREVVCRLFIFLFKGISPKSSIFFSCWSFALKNIFWRVDPCHFSFVQVRWLKKTKSWRWFQWFLPSRSPTKHSPLKSYRWPETSNGGRADKDKVFQSHPWLSG